MPRDAYLTLTVRNLPLGTTAHDVRDHILRYDSTANPQVGTVVRDSNRPSLYTTVTIRQDSDDKCKALRDGLNLKDFYPRTPETPGASSKISVNDEFLGVTTIAEHENPQFE